MKAARVAEAMTSVRAMRIPASHHRQGEGEFDAAQDLPRGHPHPARGLADRGVDPPEGGVGVDQDRGEGEDGEGDQGRGGAEAEVRQGEEEDRQAGDDAEGVEDVDDGEGGDARARGQDAERDADGDADRKGDGHQQEWVPSAPRKRSPSLIA
jgi:hypothetical protein